jgi:hypothetical protein
MVLNWMLGNSSRNMGLFLEMRLGKTLLTIRYLKMPQVSLEGWKPWVLVVCPNSVVPTWCNELKEEGETYTALGGSSKDKLLQATEFLQGNSDRGNTLLWVVVNYEGLRACPSLADFDWKSAVLDESTRIKNPQSKIAKLVTTKFRNAADRLILSGFPTPEGPLDIFMQSKFLADQCCGVRNYWQFRDSMFQQKFSQWNWQPKTGTVDRITRFMAPFCYYLTRHQVRIPGTKVYEKRYVDPTPEQVKAVREIKETWALGDKTTKWSFQVALWLSQIAGGFWPHTNQQLSGRKIEEVSSLVTGDLAGSRVVVWFRFNRELFATAGQLARVVGAKAVGVLVGGMPLEERQAAINNSKILCCQIKVGMIGINLSAYDAFVYYSNSYSLEERIQSEDRGINVARTSPVLIMDLITKGSVDETVVDALREKKLTGSRLVRHLLAVQGFGSEANVHNQR